jgi:SpoIID/LytB domain protein
VLISNQGFKRWRHEALTLQAQGPYKVFGKLFGPSAAPHGKAFTYSGQPGDVLTFTPKAGGTATLELLLQKASAEPTTQPTKALASQWRLEAPSSQVTWRWLTVNRGGEPLQLRGSLALYVNPASPQNQPQNQPQTKEPPTMWAVNELGLEYYLQGVVPNELPIRFGPEAVKAQAVAARTYALYPRGFSVPQLAGKVDICDSQFCQAYYGAQTETEGTNEAVRQTEGWVLLYQQAPALALFSSSTGGISESYTSVFKPLGGANRLPYLNPVADEGLESYFPLNTEERFKAFLEAPGQLPPEALETKAGFDVASPHYRWERQWNADSLSLGLAQSLNTLWQEDPTWVSPAPPASPEAFGTLEALHVLQRGEGGKIMRLQITSSQGTWVLQQEGAIRRAFVDELTGKPLPSASVAFTLQRTAEGTLQGVQALGTGFGHGVGLSQYGASRMHRLGYSFPAVLRHYYPHTQLGTVPLPLPTLPQAARCATVWVQSQQATAVVLQANPLASKALRHPAAVHLRINGQAYSLPWARARAEEHLLPPELLQPNTSNTVCLQPVAWHHRSALPLFWLTFEAL